MIWCVEDDASIRDIEVYTLSSTGFDARGFEDGVSFWSALQTEKPDLVVLDVMLPGVDGFTLMDYIAPTGTPVIFLTAKATVEDRVRGLRLGAYDYIVKPFAPAELVARVESVLRRAGRSMVVYHLWDLTVDTAACRIQRGDEEIRLTPKEYELLLLFLRNRGRALYRDYLYETVWGDDGTGWSLGWKINFWARLRDGNHALKLFDQQLRFKASTGMNYSHGGGTYENLFDAHPPFQIDGNFGGTAGITEMLLQSHMGFIQLLPALPDAWANGSISGICAKGNFEVSISWKEGQLEKVIIHSKSGIPCNVRYGDKTLKFKTVKGKKYEITLKGDKLAVL